MDPAIMASPLITTIVDAVSLVIYFAAVSYTHLDVYKRQEHGHAFRAAHL